MPTSGGGATSFARRVMVFIDGGYLRSNVRTLTGNEEFDLLHFPWKLATKYIKGRFFPDLIRVYYYDALVDTEHQDYPEQRQFFDSLNSIPLVEVKLGSLVQTPNGRRQKSVDIFMSIDVLTKAFENHYDVAILVCGDRDFIPLVESVKDNTGKMIFGFGFEKHYSVELSREFDIYRTIDKEFIDSLIKDI